MQKEKENEVVSVRRGSISNRHLHDILQAKRLTTEDALGVARTNNTKLLKTLAGKQDEVRELQDKNANLEAENADLRIEVGDLQGKLKAADAALHEQPAVVATATLPLPPASVNACDAGAMAKEHTGDGSTGDLDDSHPQDDAHTLPMPRAAYTMVVLPMATPSNALSIADSATRAPGQRV